jgi:hypothetical protein
MKKKTDETLYVGKLMKLTNKADFEKVVREKIIHQQSSYLPNVMPLLNFYIWIDVG